LKLVLKYVSNVVEDGNDRDKGLVVTVLSAYTTTGYGYCCVGVLLRRYAKKVTCNEVTPA